MTRIIAGRAKGTQLTVPRCGTRPTSDRVREALFSTLVTWFGTVGEPAEKHLVGAAVLDLYAGTGAVAPAGEPPGWWPSTPTPRT